MAKKLTRGDIIMNEIKEQKKKKEKEYAKLEKLRDKYLDFAFEGICPDCGKKLEKPKEVIYFIDGEFGPVVFYIRCSCGFYFSTMPKDKEKQVEDYFTPKIEPTKKSFLERMLGK